MGRDSAAESLFEVASVSGSGRASAAPAWLLEAEAALIASPEEAMEPDWLREAAEAVEALPEPMDDPPLHDGREPWWWLAAAGRDIVAAAGSTLGRVGSIGTIWTGFAAADVKPPAITAHGALPPRTPAAVSRLPKRSTPVEL